MASACPVCYALQVGVIDFSFYSRATAAYEHLRTRYLPAILQFCVDDSKRHVRVRRTAGCSSLRRSAEDSCEETTGDVGRPGYLNHIPASTHLYYRINYATAAWDINATS